MGGQERDVVLALEDVSLQFQTSKAIFDRGRHTVLDHVSLELYRGETLGIIGGNGSGKSTVLRLMAGILAPSSGRVHLARDCSIALLSLGMGFRPTLSGRDNALLSVMLQGQDRARAESLLEEIKAFSELGDSFEEPVKTYSSGMRSRLGFATAMMAEVDVLLIDETLSVGDAHFRQKAQATLQERIVSDQTVVFVSHAAPQVKRLCGRAIWLQDGRVGASGETGAVLAEYERYVESIKAR